MCRCRICLVVTARSSGGSLPSCSGCRPECSRFSGGKDGFEGGWRLATGCWLLVHLRPSKLFTLFSWLPPVGGRSDHAAHPSSSVTSLEPDRCRRICRATLFVLQRADLKL